MLHTLFKLVTLSPGCLVSRQTTENSLGVIFKLPHARGVLPQPVAVNTPGPLLRPLGTTPRSANSLRSVAIPAFRRQGLGKPFRNARAMDKFVASALGCANGSTIP
jgi:hypothetical protein